VCDVVQQGWRFRGKVLRFARVVVARNDRPDDTESGPAGRDAGADGPVERHGRRVMEGET
jgi:hypothetical protein